MNKLKCYCIKSNYRQTDNVKYKFQKNSEYNYIDPCYMLLTSNYDHNSKMSDNLENIYYFSKEQFSKCFTTDIKYIRKQKLNKLKKVRY